MGGGPYGRHGGSVHAGGAGPVRLPCGVLLAGAGAGPVESCAELDGEMRDGAEGLAETGSGFSVKRGSGFDAETLRRGEKRGEGAISKCRLSPL